MSIVDDNLIDELMGGGETAPSQNEAKTASVADSVVDDILGDVGGSAPSRQSQPKDDVLPDMVKRANELSYEEGITFPEALERVKNEDVGFIQGVGRSIIPAARNRLTGMAQATGLDEKVGNFMKDRGMIPEDTDVDQVLREGVTERKDSLEATADRSPVGSAVGQFIGDAAAIAPAVPAMGSGALGITAMGAIGGMIEGGTRAEGVGEDQDRGFNTALGGAIGAPTAFLMGQGSKLYQRYLSDDVNRTLGKGVDKASSFFREVRGGKNRFSKEGVKLLHDRGYDPKTVPTEVALDLFNGESKAITATRSLQSKVGRILKDTDPAQVQENLARFDSLGINPTLGQATGNSTLLSIERNLGFRGDPKISEPLKARMRIQATEELPVATQAMIQKIGGRQSLDDVADRVVSVAGKIRKGMINERMEKAAPLYGQALSPDRRIGQVAEDGTVVLSDKAQGVLNHPRIQSIIARIRKDKDFSQVVEGMPDDSVEFLHHVKTYLDDVIGTASKESRKTRSNILTGLKQDLLDVMDESTIAQTDMPELGVKAGESLYRKARNTFSDESELIKTYQDSVLGAVADLSEGRIDMASRKIFAMKDLKRFKEVKNKIRKEDSQVWDAMVARHMTDILEDLPAVPNKDYRAFARKLAGKERSGKMLQTALEDSPEQLKLFKDMMHAIADLENLDFANHPKGSMTMPNFEKANFVDDYFAANKFKLMDKLSADLFKDLADQQQSQYVSDVLSQLSRMLTNPDSVNDLAKGKVAGRLATFLTSEEGKAMAKARTGKVLNRHDRAMMFMRAAMGEHIIGSGIDKAGAAIQKPAILSAPIASQEITE